MNVLSLFDGISCGMVALERAEIPVETYYAAEVNKFATAISMKNYPSIVRVGNVCGWKSWDIDWSQIDLVFAGFPCQAWSVAGKQLGDKDDRGMLFWVMLDIIKHVQHHNPRVKFLIENVKMKKEFEEYITYHTNQALGEVHKTLINSALVSAQNRKRYYWTNFETAQPEDKKIFLKDILEYGCVDRDKSYCIDASYHKGGNLDQYFNKSRRQLVFAQRPRGKNKGGIIPGGKSSTLTANSWEHNNFIADVPVRDKSKTVRSSGRNSYDRHEWDSISDCHYRKLTVTECERLQTLPDGYTDVDFLDIDRIALYAMFGGDQGLKDCVSNTQRYKAIGNGWTVDVITRILECMTCTSS